MKKRTKVLLLIPTGLIIAFVITGMAAFLLLKDRTFVTVQATQQNKLSIDTVAIHEKVNAFRSVEGLNKLVLNQKLSNAALARCNDMVAKGYFGHVSPDGVNPAQAIGPAMPEATSLGENIAQGYTSPDELVEAWIKSPDHKVNLENRNYTDEGIAYCDLTRNGTPTIYIVEDFAVIPK